MREDRTASCERPAAGTRRSEVLASGPRARAGAETDRWSFVPRSERGLEDGSLPPPAPVLPRPSARCARGAVSAGSYSIVVPRTHR